MTKITTIGTRVRDVWRSIGIALLLLCLVEGSLSLVFLMWDRFSEPDLTTAIPDAYSDPTWLNEYNEELRLSYFVEWKPYVYWRRKPYRGTHVNIDTNGIRRTAVAKPLQDESRTPARIFMFGGSTMWGTGARDAYTIPSALATELQNKGIPAEVTNFGETGYVTTQEVVALVLQLQAGQRPDVVIFYDGVNDLYSAYQQRVTGLPQNEFNRATEFNLSNPTRARDARMMVVRDLTTRLSTTRFLKGLLRRAGLRAAADANPLPPGDSAAESDALAQDVLATYRGNIEIVKALSERYHFKYLFYWQPTIFQKAHVTDFERGERAKGQTIEHFVHRTFEVVRQSRLAENPEYSFHDLSLVFADLREPVYIDWIHLGELGNEIIAKRMASDVHGLFNASQ